MDPKGCAFLTLEGVGRIKSWGVSGKFGERRGVASSKDARTHITRERLQKEARKSSNHGIIGNKIPDHRQVSKHC